VVKTQPKQEREMSDRFYLVQNTDFLSEFPNDPIMGTNLCIFRLTKQGFEIYNQACKDHCNNEILEIEEAIKQEINEIRTPAEKMMPHDYPTLVEAEPCSIPVQALIDAYNEKHGTNY
jgi:hypothetical protein